MALPLAILCAPAAPPPYHTYHDGNATTQQLKTQQLNNPTLTSVSIVTTRKPHMPTIEQEIQQTTFTSPAHRTQLNILFTAGWINQQTMQALRPFGLSIQQFNILRILRGRRGKPATVKLLTERMLDKMSNASRLVDKLKEKGYVRRQECETDRRRVDIVITKKGLDIVGQASKAMERDVIERFSNLNSDEFAQLSDLLDRLRG